MAKRSLEERLALYRARFCYVEETYCVQQPAGHYIRAYADPQTRSSRWPSPTR